MKKLTIASMTLAAIFGLNAQAQMQSQPQNQNQSSQSQGSQSSQSSARFIQKAAEINLTEVELGKLGAQKSQNSQVQQYSKDLEKDHQSANQKLQSIAQEQGVQFPQSVSSKQQREIDKLKKLSGTQFDQEFSKVALKGHAKALQFYQREAQQAQDPAIKQYAQSMVPALEHHLNMAKNMASNVGLSQTTITSILSRYPEAVGGASTPGGSQQGSGSSSQQPSGGSSQGGY